MKCFVCNKPAVHHIDAYGDQYHLCARHMKKALRKLPPNFQLTKQ